MPGSLGNADPSLGAQTMTTSKFRFLCGAAAILLATVGMVQVGKTATSTPIEPPAMDKISATAQPAALRASDLAGVSHLLQDDPKVRASALVFISTQCPISNKYIPELNRMAAAAPAGGEAVCRDLRSDGHPRRCRCLREGIPDRVPGPVRCLRRACPAASSETHARGVRPRSQRRRAISRADRRQLGRSEKAASGGPAS